MKGCLFVEILAVRIRTYFEQSLNVCEGEVILHFDDLDEGHLVEVVAVVNR